MGDDENLENGRGTLILLDYPGRRRTGRLADLSLEEEGFACQYLLSPPLPDALTGRSYAKVLRERLGSTGAPLAILAYCAAAPLAQELAQLIAESENESLPLILFDAAEGSLTSIVECWSSAAKQIQKDAPSTVTIDATSLAHDPSDFLDQARRELISRAQRALSLEGRDGLEIKSDIEAMVAGYIDFLNYLIAAYLVSRPHWGGDVFHIVSADHAGASDWSGARRTVTVRVPCDSSRLLRSPLTRRAVLSLLTDE